MLDLSYTVFGLIASVLFCIVTAFNIYKRIKKYNEVSYYYSFMKFPVPEKCSKNKSLKAAQVLIHNKSNSRIEKIIVQIPFSLQAPPDANVKIRHEKNKIIIDEILAERSCEIILFPSDSTTKKQAPEVYIENKLMKNVMESQLSFIWHRPKLLVLVSLTILTLLGSLGGLAYRVHAFKKVHPARAYFDS